MFAFYNRAFGTYWPAYWAMMACNVVIPQALWFPRVRRNVPLLFGISIGILYGKWLERYVIIITSLHRDFLPSSWGFFDGTIWDHLTFYGTIGLFLLLFSLFVRFLPLISIYEVRELIHHRGETAE
jgi:molybdopterin-containing oxidoreductase family membrane subunit